VIKAVKRQQIGFLLLIVQSVWTFQRGNQNP